MIKKNKKNVSRLVTAFIRKMPVKIGSTLFSKEEIHSLEIQIMADLDFYVKSDPAARNSHELVKNTYVGFRAVAFYRIAHHIVKKAIETGNEKLHEYARLISERMKVNTGIEIHPAADIKAPFMIDHGWGVVIGETAEIGAGCCLLNGVVLGAKGIIGNPNAKRHPTLGDNVQIGAFTEILGDIKIGSNTIVGPRLKVMASIPDNSILIRKTEYWILRNNGQSIFTL